MSGDRSGDSIPPIRRTPPFGNPSGAFHELEDRVNDILIRVDRLQQANKLLRWAAGVAITFALGSVIAVARMLYGLGADDATIRAMVERAQRQADENKADIRELSRYMYVRRSSSGTLLPAPPTKEDP